MPVRSLKDGTVTLYDGGSNSLALVADEGDFSFVAKQPANIISVRGVLDHARKGNEEYFDISFSMQYETLSTHLSVTPYDFLTKSGGAASYVSAGETNDTYAVKLGLVAASADTTEASDDMDFIFYPEEIQGGEGDPYGVITVSGRGRFSADYYIKQHGLGWWKFDDPAYLWQNTAKSTAVTSDTHLVRVVEDRLGSNDLVAPSDGDRFMYKTNQLNGNDICRADGSDDNMVSGAFSGLSAQPYYVFCIFEFVSVGAPDTVFGGLDSSHAGLFETCNSPAEFCINAGTNLVSGVANDNAPHVVEAYFNGGASSVKIDDSVAVVGNAGTAHISSGIRIGSKYGDAQFSNVDYLELAVIKSNIPAAELLKIFNAFRTKAGV